MSQKKLPRFASEEEEAEFWDRECSVEWAGPEVKMEFPRRPKGMISIRLEDELLDGIRRLAKGRAIGYQTLMRQWLWERLEQETRTPAAPRRRAQG